MDLARSRNRLYTELVDQLQISSAVQCCPTIPLSIHDRVLCHLQRTQSHHHVPPSALLLAILLRIHALEGPV